MPSRGRRVSALSAGLLLLGGAQGCHDTTPAAWLEEAIPVPRIFGAGVISTGLREYGITFSPDAREAYFTRRARRGPAQIFESRFVDGIWTEPTLVEFSGDYDQAPHISPDGRVMVFTSRRLMPGSGDRSDNLWTSVRADARWGAPIPLPGLVNEPSAEDDGFRTGSEVGPELLPDGSILFWSRRDPDWGADVYRAERLPDQTFGAPTPLRINSTGEETNVAMSPDGQYLILEAYRDASAPGGQDLYVSRRNAYGWDVPVLLPGPFNSPANDGYPSFSPDGRFFFFASDRDQSGGYYDIWYVDADALNLDELTGSS